MIYPPTDFKWTSDSNGDASLELAESKRGKSLIRVQTIPGANGDLTTDLPTDQYNVTIKDAFGEDLAASECLDRSGTVSESINTINNGIPITTALTITISDAGDTKQGMVRLVFRDDN